jgi:hypothetical protein
MCVALPTPVVASDALSGLALSQAIRTFKNGWVAVSATGSKSFNRSNGPWPVALVKSNAEPGGRAFHRMYAKHGKIDRQGQQTRKLLRSRNSQSVRSDDRYCSEIVE